MLKKLFSNRLLLIAGSLIIAAVIVATIYNSVNQVMQPSTVVQVNDTIEKGQQIRAEQLSEVEVTDQDAFGGYAVSKDDVVGKFALTDFFKDDYILVQKVADKITSVSQKLNNLPEGKIAVAVQLPESQKTLSEKIVAGDVVSVYTEFDDQLVLLPYLTYMEVLAATTTSGVEKENPDAISEDRITNITFMATPQQASQLLTCQKSLHLALVCRGTNSELAKSLLSEQDMYLAVIEAEKPVSTEAFSIVEPYRNAKETIDDKSTTSEDNKTDSENSQNTKDEGENKK